ncbi:MAG: type II toxin-antitoxin system VapC family toxin [Candidatus Hydrothermarchaeales archaeon]
MNYVDANIIIHNLIGDRRVGKAAKEYLKSITRGEIDACTSVHTIAEVYAFLKGTGKSEREIGKILSKVLSYGIRLLPLKPSIVVSIPEGMEKGWKYGDTIHYLTMKEEGISKIVSDDKFFDKLDVLRIDVTKL